LGLCQNVSPNKDGICLWLLLKIERLFALLRILLR
jgi:hypothetical protein